VTETQDWKECEVPEKEGTPAESIEAAVPAVEEDE
jgi:hypothetical protein